jgi:hypothetical protein
VSLGTAGSGFEDGCTNADFTTGFPQKHSSNDDVAFT